MLHKGRKAERVSPTRELDPQDATPTVSVTHYGPDPTTVGGMATVIGVMHQRRVGAENVRVQATWTPDGPRAMVSLWLRSLISAWREPRETVAHVHLSERGSFVREGIVIALAAFRGRPVIATIHGADFDAFSVAHPRICGFVLGRASAVTVLSATTQFAVAQCTTTETRLIPNPVVIDETPTPAGSQPLRVLFAGEIGYRKGADVLLAAWPAVATAHPEAELAIMGPRTELEIPGLPGLTVLPPGDTASVRAQIRSSRAVVLPSRAEAMPMFLLEAMASGRPFIATPVGGIPALARAGGVLVATDDAEALSDAISQLLRDADLATETGQAGWDSVRSERSVAAIDSSFGTLYREVIARSRPRRRRDSA